MIIIIGTILWPNPLESMVRRISQSAATEWYNCYATVEWSFQWKWSETALYTCNSFMYIHVPASAKANKWQKEQVWGKNEGSSRLRVGRSEAVQE